MRFVCRVAWLLRYLNSSIAVKTPVKYHNDIDGLVQERHNSIANALPCTKPSICADVRAWMSEYKPQQLWVALTHPYPVLSYVGESPWKPKIVIMPILSPKAALEAVTTTTSGATSDDKLGIITILGFQWRPSDGLLQPALDCFTFPLHNPNSRQIQMSVGLSVASKNLWEFPLVTWAHNTLQITQDLVWVRNPPTNIESASHTVF